VAVVCVGEELVRAPARGALQVVFNQSAGPLRIEEVLQGASAFGDCKGALIHRIQETTSEFEILLWLVEAQAIFELFAVWAERH
jgi:hypothetical protein